jgi:SAM-dependent methyltransferase
MPSKSYDAAYFRRWYHNPHTRIDSATALRRKVLLAVSVTEYMLARRIRTVLDVGCGEARWRAPLRELRPNVSYLGLDPSSYIVRQYGQSHHVRRGGLGTLRELEGTRRYDLIVCADVIQYVATPELRRGLREIRRLLAGVAYIEAFAAEDDMEGDTDGWFARPAAPLRRLFREAGLAHCGVNCFVNLRRISGINQLELCGDLRGQGTRGLSNSISANATPPALPFPARAKVRP